MKTFLYSIPNKIQSFSKRLDVKASLCGKSWEVFNDEGVKQLFIFNEDGTILITNNGNVFNASWKFIPQNSSILITTDDETIMFRPAFFNKDVFALKQDGTERYLLMIDEEKKSYFPNLSLDTLSSYIEKEIASVPVEAEEKKRQLQLEKQREEDEKKRQRQIEKQQKENERREQLQIEEQREVERLKQETTRKQLLKEQERQLLLGYIEGHREEINRKVAKKKRIGLIGAVLSCLLIIPACFIHDIALKWSAILFLVVSLFVCLASRVATPTDVINRHLEGGIRYHSDFEVSKMCEDNQEDV